MAASGDFLARIKLVVEGQAAAVANLQTIEKMTKSLSGVPVETVFSKEGLKAGKDIAKVTQDIGTAAGGAGTKMGDFEKALKRVIIVAPVWMAFRAVLQGTISILQDGFKTWEEFDRQLIKSKAVIHDFSGTSQQAMQQLEGTIRDFSKQSGIALDQLASSFYRFGTVGIAFQDALSGAIASAKLAKATLGDVDTISRSLAMTYRLLGDTIDTSLSPMEKQESLAGKILQLWKSNAFESNEFAQSLTNFVSTANIANFTADQTVALLAALGTAGVQGARGGTLLRTSIQKLVENLGDLAPKLGIAVNPELENTFDLFMRVLRAVNELSQTKGIPAEALDSIRQIFGGVRGAQVISALNALLPELQKNLSDLGKDPQTFIRGLNDRFKEVTDTVSGQLDIFRELRKQLGESFVKGITGANNYKDALKEINDILKDMQAIAFSVGFALNLIGKGPSGLIAQDASQAQKEMEKYNEQVNEAFRRALNYEQVLQLILKIQKEMGETELSNTLITQLTIVAEDIRKTEAEQAGWAKTVEDFNKKYIQTGKIQVDTHKNLLRQLSLQKKETLAGLEVIKLQTLGYEESDIILAQLSQQIQTMLDTYNSLDKVVEGTLPKLDKQAILTDVLNRNWQGILDKAKGNTAIVGELNELSKTREKLEEAVVKQYLQQEQALRKQYLTYEKADAFERNRIRRLLELQTLTPQDLALEFEQGGFDKQLIIDYWSTFSQEGQSAINDVIQRLYNLPRVDFGALIGLPDNRGLPTTTAPITNNIVGAEIQQVNVNLSGINFESIADEAGRQVAEKLKSDEAFQELVAKGIRNKL